MPLITYLCTCKHSVQKFFRQAKDAPAFLICAKCGLESKKQLSSSTFSSKVTVDNGFQAKKVEVDLDLIEINKSRSEKDYKND